MDDDVARELVDAYPEIFELYDADPDDFDGPAPTFAIFGFECENGWRDIIESLCEVIDRRGVDLTVVQVKEKFGGLRFYHDGIQADDERSIQQVFGAVQHAHEMSFRVCEHCGLPGELRRDGGWFRVRCDSCWEHTDLPSERSSDSTE